MLPRSIFLRRVASCMGFAAWLSACSGEAQRPGIPPRHVLLITVDTLRADHLSSWMYQRPTTYLEATEEQRKRRANLAIDDLAQQGVIFTQAFAPRGETCPSLASLFTSMHPLEHGLLENERVLAPELQTLGECFQAAGFATAAFVTNPLLGPGSGFEQGFGEFRCLVEGDRDYKAVIEAVQWVKRQGAAQAAGTQAQPLFLWLHLMGPHLPYEPLKLGKLDYATLFTDPDYRGSASGSREFLDAAYADGRALSGEDLYHVVALYDGEIARVNALVHAFLQVYSGQAPKDQPIDFLSDSVLVFTADHGEELYQRNRYWAHSKSVYSSVLHVPLILRHAERSLTGKRAIDEIVELQDVMPTLLEWFDLDAPLELRGRSLLPLVDSYVERPFESRPAFASWRDKIFSVRDARWRLVWNPERVEPEGLPRGGYPVPELALFEVERDPLELRDVASEFPEEVERLRGAIEDWRTGLRLADSQSAVGPSAQRAADLGDLGYAEVEEHPDQ